MLNKPLLRKVMEKIEELPSYSQFCNLYLTPGYDGDPMEVWDQTNWLHQLVLRGRSCGTAACFAGWTAILANANYHLDYQFVQTKEGTRSISEFAREELGLTHEEAYNLFNANNTKAELRRMVDELLEREEDA